MSKRVSASHLCTALVCLYTLPVVHWPLPALGFGLLEWFDFCYPRAKLYSFSTRPCCVPTWRRSDILNQPPTPSKLLPTVHVIVIVSPLDSIRFHAGASLTGQVISPYLSLLACGHIC
ncbi:hypothetical protein P171DRAFT_29716 [Karstenula rhodostoma CBS 690.94]|uniref:Uncharacterized protein n=1 Tax=Karstenula rhodostoma CBS 690.94 TaxID=1392251 RepID=A0A9P4UBJ0_9PLEO|nr:hypothetical protein P171DRAFT_29716 [Karstenula rhodostoma CBS 690.94]